MTFTKIINSDFSGHTLHVSEIDASVIPAFANKNSYSKFYVVRNQDANGMIFLYLGKGFKDAPNEIVAWYPKTRAFWSGYGNTLKQAIEDAQKDGWLYA